MRAASSYGLAWTYLIPEPAQFVVNEGRVDGRISEIAEVRAARGECVVGTFIVI